MPFAWLEKWKEYEIKHESWLLSNEEEKIVETTNDKLRKNIIPESNKEDIDILKNTWEKLQKILNKYSMKNIISDTQKLSNDDIITYINALIWSDRNSRFNKPILENGKLVLSNRSWWIEQEIPINTQNLWTIRKSLLWAKEEIANIIQKNKSWFVIINGKFLARPNRPDFSPVVELKESSYINDKLEKTSETLSDLSKTFFETWSSEIKGPKKLIEKIKTNMPSIINAINNGKKLQLTGMVDNVGANPQKDNNPEKQNSNLSINRAKSLKKFLINKFKLPENKIIISDWWIKEERRVDFNFI